MLRNVLFIGNSHTYYNYMPQMLAALVDAEDRGFKLIVHQCTGEGASLEWHWHNADTRDTIRARPWDYIVLQDRSGGPLENPDSFKRHARLLDGDIRHQGARTMLFLTWANQSRPETQAALTNTYQMTAHKLQAVLAPVGLAWEAIQRMDPGIELYHGDGRHASPAGSYLTACTFYALLFNTSPQGLSGRFYHKGRMWVDLEKDQASLIHNVAWETVSSLNAKEIAVKR
jgi:hypothetical protein